ncbi:hypothetical protein AB0B89_15855 [Sphaerisporangium sp. NPDC049002]|uniref:hypothetical protein n=1 Tax=unclassified Sphaerisporangium TaxID=2630420 RepID=UPI003400F1B6
MTNQHDSFPDMMHEDLGFEVVMRGYSRRQVHDHMVRTRNQIRDLEERLARAIDQAEQGRIELGEARRRLAEAPQDYDELGQRLSQILKLAEEEAISKRETADTEATKMRDDASAESERILTAAQAEAERRVEEATDAAERLLAQAGADAEETLGSARAESEETLRTARAEADRSLTAARHEAERLVSEANNQAEATLASAKADAEATVKAARAEAADTLAAAGARADALDEHTGRRVTFLTDTHTEVMRRLNEMGSVLTDLLHREGTAGALVDESAVLPPRPVLGSVDDLRRDDPIHDDGPAAEELESVRVVLDADGDDRPGHDGAAFGPADVPHVPGADHAGEVHGPGGAYSRDGGYSGDLGDARDANDAHAANDVHKDDDEEGGRVHVLRDAHDLRDPNETVDVGGRGDVDPRHGNDHEGPGKGRVRNFFEETDVHLSRVPDQSGGDGLPAHRQ